MGFRACACMSKNCIAFTCGTCPALVLAPKGVNSSVALATNTISCDVHMS